MAIPELGKLAAVHIRAAWGHEATSFTPWLAEHLDSLADLIGIPLELEGMEVSVGTFYADILARNPNNDSRVLIENQLERTDHRHLGQIMTYLAGLDAQAVVWIAAGFHESHISALQWLNDHTVEPFAFFAVRVKAVRIGDSPIAPLFDVVCQPNHWERQVQAMAREAQELSPLGQFRRDFWTAFVEQFPEELKYGPATARSVRWRHLDFARIVITQYFTKHSVGVYVRSSERLSGDEFRTYLEPHGERLGVLTGSSIDSRDGNMLFVSSQRAAPSDPTQQPELMSFLHVTADRYEAAFREVFADVDEGTS